LPARGLFNRIVALFRQRLSSLPDKRTGKNKRYGMEDAALSAFSVFFTQTPSFLAYQRMMEGRKGKSNAQSLFGVHQIPSDNQIRNLLDPVSPEQVFPVFEDILQVLEQQGQLERLSLPVRHPVGGDGWDGVFQVEPNPLRLLLHSNANDRRNALLPQRCYASHRLSGAVSGDSLGARVYRAARWS
jgi:hypothetical protein